MSEKVFELEAPEHVPRIEHDETWHGIRDCFDDDGGIIDAESKTMMRRTLDRTETQTRVYDALRGLDEPSTVQSKLIESYEKPDLDKHELDAVWQLFKE
jgi:hypothetical protein